MLATKYWKGVRGRFGSVYMKDAIAHIRFLECSVYIVYDYCNGKWLDRGVLAEKMLDQSKYTKWNGNNGYVHGLGPANVQTLAALLNSMSLSKGAQQTAALAPVSRFTGGLKLENVLEEEEGSEDYDCEDVSTEDDVQEDEPYGGTSPWTNTAIQGKVELLDFPQAFSHFSYIHTERKMLVCDLQGVLDESVWPPMYELTDPVIHYASSGGRTKVYGRTDRGKKGIADFFSSHKCNVLCRVLGLTEHV